jgi:hypothetical protein
VPENPISSSLLQHKSLQPTNLLFQNQPNISGNKTNPADNPDRLAFMLLFRFLSNPLQSQDEKVRKQSRAYLKQVPLGKKRCATCSDADPTEDVDANALIGVANEYQLRVKVLDERAVRLKQQNQRNPIPNLREQLIDLQRQKEALADELIASLPRRLSNHANLELKRLIQGHIKKNIQLN